MTPQQAASEILRHLNSAAPIPAFKLAKTAMKTWPKEALFYNLAGMTKAAQNQNNEAISLFKKALSLRTGFPEALHNLAQALILSDRAKEAIGLLEKAVAKTPNDAKAFYLLAQALMQNDAPRRAIDAVDQALKNHPDLVGTHNLRGICNLALADFKSAEQDFKAAMQSDATAQDAATNLASLYMRQTRFDDAHAVLDAALNRRPDHVSTLLSAAELALATGKKSEARRFLDRVLALAPSHVLAMAERMKLAQPDEVEGHKKRLENALPSLPKASPDLAAANFALAKLAQNAGDFTAEKRALERANAAQSKITPYTPAWDTKRHEACQGVVPTSSTKANEDAPFPIFITGLPRSGTTLAETILSAHPQVHAMGEQAMATVLAKPIWGDGAAFDATDFAKSYRDALPQMPAGTRAFTDKMPDNYIYIGMLQQAFPNAVFINMRRDPRDTALSLWRSWFSGGLLSFAYDLRGIAHRINLHTQMMQHWMQANPELVHELRYEDMVSDIETTAHQIAQWCGLEYEPAMAKPHAQAVQIMTVSNDQVRQPAHTESIAGWTMFEDVLKPVSDRLDEDLWADYLTPK